MIQIKYSTVRGLVIAAKNPFSTSRILHCWAHYNLESCFLMMLMNQSNHQLFQSEFFFFTLTLFCKVSCWRRALQTTWRTIKSFSHTDPYFYICLFFISYNICISVDTFLVQYFPSYNYNFSICARKVLNKGRFAPIEENMIQFVTIHSIVDKF